MPEDLTDGIVAIIDRATAVLSDLRRPLSDLVSDLDAQLYNLRQARFALRPGQSPATAEAAHRKAAKTVAPKTTDGLPKGRWGVIIRMLREAESPLAMKAIIDRLHAQGDECSQASASATLSALLKKKWIARQGHDYTATSRP